MGTVATDMVRTAVELVIGGDADQAEQLIARDDQVDHFERQIIQKTVLVLVSESPVSSDLRFLLSTLGIVGEIEKVGDHAVKLARRVTKLSTNFPTELRVSLVELGEDVRRNFSRSLRLYTDFSAEEASELIEADRIVDATYREKRKRLVELIQQQPEGAAHLFRTIECFHALEHVADHSVAIATRLQLINVRPE